MHSNLKKISATLFGHHILNKNLVRVAHFSLSTLIVLFFFNNCAGEGFSIGRDLSSLNSSGSSDTTKTVFHTALPAYTLYISLSGNDSNSGSADSPIKTLGQALNMVKLKRKSGDTPVKIIFFNGIYYRNTIIWDSFSSVYKTEFLPKSGRTGDVIFDGRSSSSESYGSTTYLFRFHFPQGMTTGGATNIYIHNLKIQYYLEGINFLGITRNEPKTVDSSHPSLFSSQNEISNCEFHKIGNRYCIKLTGSPPKPVIGMAVIRLVNSKKNIFTNNLFFDINNAPYDSNQTPLPQNLGGGLHAFYVAHNSSNNIFEANRFVNHMSGSAIKIRDNSNNNQILRNDFESVYPNPVQLWHCEVNERGTRDDNLNGCTKFPPREDYECLSYGTKEDGNIYRGFSSGKSPFNIFLYPSYACRPSSTNIEFTRENQIVGTGIIQSTPTNGVTYYGRCENISDCVNSNNNCDANYTGSSNLLCVNNDWQKCSLTQNFENVLGQNVCLPTSDRKDAVWTAIPKNSFFTKSTFSSSTYYGFCSTNNACINDKGTCYTSLTGSAHLLCENLQWRSCSMTIADAAAGDSQKLTKGNPSVGFKACLPTDDHADATWKVLPNNRFYIISRMYSKWNYAFCTTANSCVNASGSCYLNNTGSPHVHCENKVWKSCTSSVVGNKSGTKTCQKMRLPDESVDYQWK